MLHADTATAPSPATPQAPAGATPVLQAPANAQPLPAASAPAAPATGMIPDPAAITTQAMMQVTTSPGYPPTGTMQQGIVQMQASVPAVQPTPAAAAADSSPEKGKDKDKGNWWSLGKKKTKEEELPGPSSPAALPPVGTAASPVDIQGAVQAQAQHAMQAQGMVPDPNMQHMQPVQHVQHVQQATVMPPPSGSPPMHGSQSGASATAAAGGALQGQLVPLANPGQQPHHLAQQAQNVQFMAQAGQLPDATAAASAAAVAAGLVPLQPTLPSYGHAADLPVLQQPSMQQGYANAMNSQGGVLAPNPAPFMQGQGFVPGMNAAGTSMPSGEWWPGLCVCRRSPYARVYLLAQV